MTRLAPRLVASNHESTTNTAPEGRLDEEKSLCFFLFALSDCRCVQLVEIPMDSVPLEARAGDSNYRVLCFGKKPEKLLLSAAEG